MNAHNRSKLRKSSDQVMYTYSERVANRSHYLLL